MTLMNWRLELAMCTDKRPVSDCINEIKAYDWKKQTTERMDDLKILSHELGSDYSVKVWTFNKHIRVAVIYDGHML